MSSSVKAPKTHIAHGSREGASVAELQRRRLLAATVQLLGDGTSSANVATICARAGVSRRTFYELFEDRDACLLAAFSQALEHAESVVARAVEGEIRWRSQVRAGLTALIQHLDREPGEARLLLVEALRVGNAVLDARRHALERLARLVDEGRAEAKRQPSSLTAEGVVGAVLSVAHSRILSGEAHPLHDLTGPFAAMIIQPYLGWAAAQREIEASSVSPAALLEAVDARPRSLSAATSDTLKGMRLTYRTALVLRSISERPGSSNRQIADASGVTDPGQISRLLARLERYGLAHNSGGESGRGEAKAWSLTTRGEGVLQVVGES